MSESTPSQAERWEELQVIRLLFGLTAEEENEYDALVRIMPAEAKNDQLTSVVAAIDLAWSNAETGDMPTHLRQKVQQQASDFMAERRPTPGKSVRGMSRTDTLGYLPWLVAATCLGLTLFAWYPKQPVQKIVENQAEQRSYLLASAKDLVQAEWGAGTTPIEGVTGDVVWSKERQLGFMRFRGLPVNEPTKEQYQLWIFDKNQSDKTPIDGGVFDISATDEVIVPIDAKLKVQEPFMFAVTIEKPGGVVVSSRDRLPLLAKVGE